MNNLQFAPICKKLATLIKHDFKPSALKDGYLNKENYGNNWMSFLEGLFGTAQKIELAFLKNYIPKNKFLSYLINANYPVLSFLQEGDLLHPIIFWHKTGKHVTAYIYKDEEVNEVNEDDDIKTLVTMLITDERGSALSVVPFSMHSVVSEDDAFEKSTLTPVKRLLKLLGAEKKDILYIYFYAIVGAIISLALPIGIQAVIELISGGVVFNSIVLLISLVILAVIVSGALQVMQYHIAEILQRRVFVKAAFEFSYRFPRVKSENLLDDYPPELINRFFDILTIQKGMPKLLIDFTGSALQIVFGLLLLSFYHPFFVFFGFTLVGALSLVIYQTGPAGLRSSLNESKYKYKVVHWLEEIARTLYSFKMAGRTLLPIQKTDIYVNGYLYYRKKHFNVLMTQFGYIIAFKTIVTGGLLSIGTWLVIDRQITLGQFVATEIVIILVLASVEKLILSMSNIYDMLTAVEKVGQVTDLALEKKGGINLSTDSSKGVHILMKGLKYKYPESDEYALKGIDLEIQPGEKVCIVGYSESGKNTLVKVLSGILGSYEGMLMYDGISMKDIDLGSLRDVVAKNVSNESIFDGTLFDNISMGISTVSYQDVMWALENVGLKDFVGKLPNGLMTEMVAGGKTFSNSVAVKITLARCIAEKPRLLVLNDMFNDLSRDEKLKILTFLMDRKYAWTLICVSNDPMVMVMCDRLVMMANGKVEKTGTYDEFVKDPQFM
ncbi:MAG: ATP-binding cassette domain-containing protein, partial [Flammeovirgaceae bacterium]|nr:ATP-binding cassette domain-containing protein [Flammeovirgaceae bacterium]